MTTAYEPLRRGPLRSMLAGIAWLLVAGAALAGAALADVPVESDAAMEPAAVIEAAATAEVGLVDAEALGPAASGLRATFPLHLKPGGRHLVDANGRPFLIHGDAAWALMAELDRAEVRTYLNARQAAGFNTILVSVLEHKFANGAPNNAYGEPPFLTPGDYMTPNERYFAHVDWVLRQAANRGFLVILTPSYLGFDGGDEGWYRTMEANGRTKLNEYGRYLGTRYRDFDNILWLNGGDYDPPNKDLVRAIAEGIRERSPNALQSFGGAPDTAALDFWSSEPWLDINTVYTYGPVHPQVAAQYKAHPEPVILLEAMYENEQSADPARLRAQAYHALLSGAAGHIFGNNPMWHFDGPTIYWTPKTWQQELKSAGTRSMTHLRSLFTRVRWWRLEPDTKNLLLRSGAGNGLNQAVAARASDGKFAIIYMPTARSIGVDLGQLAGRAVRARWYDPSSGRFSPAASSSLPAQGVRTFKPPAKNRSGFSDWVLFLQSRN